MHLVELVESYYSDFRNHSSKENEIMICCPFCVINGHSPDTGYKLGINTVAEKGHCHRCGWKATGKHLYYALADEANVKDSYETDNSIDDGTLVKSKEKAFTLKSVQLPKEFESLSSEALDHIGKQAKNYLTDRGISDGQIRRHGLGFCAVGKFSYRIIIPVYYKKHIVGFTGRSFINAEPRYLNSSGEKFLFNYPRKERKKHCILVEGPFDIFNIEKFRNIKYDVIGLAGSALTSLQVKVLARYSEIVIWTDPDEPGVEAGISIAKQLKKETNSKLFGIEPCRLTSHKDPGDLSKREALDALKRIKPWSEYLVNKLLVSVIF